MTVIELFPTHANNVEFSAKLTAVRKVDGVVGQIAVDNILCPLVSWNAMRRMMLHLRNKQSSVQNGAGFRGVCEAAIHAFSFVQYHPLLCVEWMVLVKQNMPNILSNVRRDLEECVVSAPSFLAFGRCDIRQTNRLNLAMVSSCPSQTHNDATTAALSS